MTTLNIERPHILSANYDRRVFSEYEDNEAYTYIIWQQINTFRRPSPASCARSLPFGPIIANVGHEFIPNSRHMYISPSLTTWYNMIVAGLYAMIIREKKSFKTQDLRKTFLGWLKRKIYEKQEWKHNAGNKSSYYTRANQAYLYTCFMTI